MPRSARARAIPLERDGRVERTLGLLLLLSALTFGLALAGCNTTAGVGKDLQAAGSAVTDSAQKAKTGP